MVLCVQYCVKVFRKVLTFEEDGCVGEGPHELALPWDERLEEHDGVLIVGPGMHLAVRVPPLLGQLLPAFGLGEELTDGSL